MTAEPPLDALNEVLQKERSALMSGDLDTVSDLLPAKEQLMADIATDAPLNEPQLRDLAAQLQRNQGLLTNAMDGVRQARFRLAEAKKVRGKLSTYDARGQQLSVETDTGPIVRRVY